MEFKSRSFVPGTKKLNQCTYDNTGKKYVQQYWRHCATCFSNQEEGACLNCVSICHEGHILGHVRQGMFFCDCGASADNNYVRSCCKNRDISRGSESLNNSLYTGYAGYASYIPDPVKPFGAYNNCEQCKDCHIANGYIPDTCPHRPFFAEHTMPRAPTISYNNHPVPQGPYAGSGYQINNPTKPKVRYLTPITEQKHHNSVLQTDTINDIVCQKTFTDGVISPFSISMALGLVHLGAHGNTDKELQNFMGNKYSLSTLKNLYNSINECPSVQVANAFFVRQDFRVNPKYIEATKGMMRTESGIDKNKINAYIEKKTKGLIKNLVDYLSPDTLAILINTIYFKSKWAKPFKKHDTFIEGFHNAGTTLPTKMMHKTDNFKYYEDGMAQLLEMNYMDNKIAMGFYLPNSKHGSLPQFNIRNIKNCIEYLNEETVKVVIPKFEVRKKTNLVSQLKKHGVKDLFLEDECDLSTISKEIYVEKIIHEAVVIVDEEGTEAAAVTAMMLCRNSCSRPKQPNKIFNANHPFYFYIRYMPTNTIIFVGDYKG